MRKQAILQTSEHAMQAAAGGASFWSFLKQVAIGCDWTTSDWSMWLALHRKH
jgi:hypothetical protein